MYTYHGMIDQNILVISLIKCQSTWFLFHLSSVDTLESWFNSFPCDKNCFLLFLYWTPSISHICTFGITILASPSIHYRHSCWIFGFCPSLSSKSYFNEILNLCQYKIHHFQLKICPLHNVLEICLSAPT